MLEILGLISLIVATAGFLAASFAFPFLACALFNLVEFRAEKDGEPKRTERSRLQELLVVIPVAPASEEQLAITLKTLHSALALVPRDIHYTVEVLLDGFDDGNREVAEQFTGTIIREQSLSRGKWKTLQSINAENYDWIMSLDVGTIIPFDFFIRIAPYLQNRSYQALFPSYEPTRGFITQLLWTAERILKNLENSAGGPIAAHGACMLYRGEALRETFNSIPEEHYRNDDVVLPLALRLLNSDYRTHYLSEIKIHDCVSLVSEAEDYARRRRMALGNTQWIKDLYPKALKNNWTVALLATRRIARLLWGYWLCALIFALSTMTFPILSTAMLAMTLAFLFVGNLPQLKSALKASIESPRWFFASHVSLRWK